MGLSLKRPTLRQHWKSPSWTTQFPFDAPYLGNPYEYAHKSYIARKLGLLESRHVWSIGPALIHSVRYVTFIDHEEFTRGRQTPSYPPEIPFFSIYASRRLAGRWTRVRPCHSWDIYQLVQWNGRRRDVAMDVPNNEHWAILATMQRNNHRPACHRHPAPPLLTSLCS